MIELTVDKCVLVHCYSVAEDAAQYRSNSLAFLDYWKAEVNLVACLNTGIKREYNDLSSTGADWWRSVVGQSRYRDKRRSIAPARRSDFCQNRKVPLHAEDFDYVDAASQSTSLLWLSNETSWQNVRYRQRIHAEFSVEIQSVNEYMNGIGAQGAACAS